MVYGITYVFCVLVWGSTWFLIQFQLGEVAAEWSLTYRFALAATIMFLWTWLKKQPLLMAREHHLMLFLMGLFLFSTNYILIYKGAGFITTGLVAVCFSIMTFLNILNGRLWLKQKIHGKTIWGAILGLVGLVFIFMPEVSQTHINTATLTGIGLCFIATFFASLGNTVASTEKVSNLPLLSVNAWGMFYGTLVNLIFAILSGEPMKFDWGFDYVASLLVLSIVGTVITFVVYLWLMAKIGMVNVAYIAVLLPVVALTISSLFEGYTWTGEAIMGLILILIGNVIMIRSKRVKAVSLKSG